MNYFKTYTRVCAHRPLHQHTHLLFQASNEERMEQFWRAITPLNPHEYGNFPAKKIPLNKFTRQKEKR